jgi:hypothetical protein
MAYFPTMQPFGYQDQLNQLRNANQMQNQMPMHGFQQYQPQPQMMQQPRQDQNGLIWVQGEAGAKSWYITPGSTVLLMDSENQRFYLKSADMNGVPAMRTFEYTEVGTQPQKPQESPQPVNFVSVEEFNNFREDVLKRLEDLAEPVEVSVSRKNRKGGNADE